MNDFKERIAAELIAARDRSLAYTDAEDDLLVRQHSPLMSPLVWDLAHVGNYEELWVLRERRSRWWRGPRGRGGQRRPRRAGRDRRPPRRCG
ncbi:DinB family protein, partial [Streptomyces anulatus]|uniref:DinB family protein n=1 Tax=Streptomyces anulatus TaxID=1892 RepID=UPI00342BB0AA